MWKREVAEISVRDFTFQMLSHIQAGHLSSSIPASHEYSPPQQSTDPESEAGYLAIPQFYEIQSESRQPGLFVGCRREAVETPQRQGARPRPQQAYLTVRRGGRPSATPYLRMDPPLQQTIHEQSGLAACRTFDVSPLFSTIAIFSSKL